MNREKLKRIVHDIEATDKAIKDLSAHKRDVYSDNKDEFDPKVLRKIIARRKQDPESRGRDDDLLDQYETALGMTGKLAEEAASGERTYDEAANEAGVSRRTMARHVARQKRVPKATGNGTSTHDPETGEITAAGTAMPNGQAAPSELQGRRCGNAVPEETQQPPQAAPPAIESRSPADSASAAAESHAVVPTGNEGSAGEREPAPPEPDWDDLAKTQRELNATFARHRAQVPA